MTRRVDLSVVIPCLNAAGSLSGQLEAVSGEDWLGSWDVIVVDNGSTDATLEIANAYRDRLPMLQIVDASDRRGRQHACNVGARTAGNNIVFVDADDEIAPGFVAAIGAALLEHSIVAARIDDETLNDGWISESRSGAQSRELQRVFGFLPFGSGGTLGVRRELFESLGGFSGDMDYAEDVDFCWRAQMSGHTIHIVPNAAIRYRYRSGLWSMFLQHRNFGRASALLYRDYRSHGMPGRSPRDFLRESRGVLKGFLAIRGRADAARWCRRCGRAVGRLDGSIRYRVFYA